ENGLNPSQYVLGLFVDFDPSPATNFVSMIMPVGNVPVDSWEDTDGFFTNPGPGGWSNDNIPYVVSNSLNLGFAFWQSQFGAPPFNPNARGIYEISLVLLNGADTLARTTIFVNVVPEPGSMAMLFGAAVCGVPMLRRRFRKK